LKNVRSPGDQPLGHPPGRFRASAFADVTHFSGRGMRAIADLTAQWLREGGLLD
jgi:lysophospholipase L1-like esterase